MFRVPHIPDRLVGGPPHTAPLLPIFEKVKHQRLHFLIAASRINQAVFPVANQIGGHAHAGIHHFHTAAVHALVDHRAPAFQMIARKEMDMAFFHHVAHLLRFRIAIKHKIVREPFALHFFFYCRLQLTAAQHMHTVSISLLMQRFAKPHRVLRVL